MPSTLLVSGASAGVQLHVGTHSVVNAAQGITAQGWRGAFGIPRVADASLPGLNVNFDFTVAATQLGSNVRLDFDANRPLTRASSGLELTWGLPSVVNAAQGAFAQGWHGTFGVPRVSPDVAGANLNFDFTAAYTPPPAANVGLYFAPGGPVVTHVGAGAHEWFGVHLIYNNARLVWPSGWIATRWGVPIIASGRGAHLDLDFTAAFVGQLGSNVRLDFDLNRPVAAKGWLDDPLGVPSIVNVAQGITTHGWSTKFGTARVSPDMLARNFLFDFFEALSAETALNIAFAFGEYRMTIPEGWVDHAFGTARIHTDGKVYPSGLAVAHTWGRPFVENRDRLLYPPGIAPLVLGVPDVAGEVLPATQRARVNGALDDAFGTAFVSGGVRIIDANASIQPLGFGIAMIAFSLRYVDAASMYVTTFGYPIVDKTHFLTNIGWLDEAFGLARVHDNSQEVGERGWSSAHFGNAVVDRSPRHVYPLGFRTTLEYADPSQRWGRPTARNTRQIIKVLEDIDGAMNGERFGSRLFMSVLNRNRTVQTWGQRDSHFPLTHTIHLTGRAVYPRGFDALDQGRPWWERALVAYAIRHVYPEPMEPGQVARWTVVIKTPQLFVASIPPSWGIGRPSVVKTRRYFDHIGGWESLRFGAAFVAPRVRHVTQYWPWESRFGQDHIVWYGTRRLALAGIDAGRFGGRNVLEIHFSRVFPHWPTRADAFGAETRIRNVTPEVHAYGYRQDEWGRTRIFNRENYYAIQGWRDSIVSRGAVIHDRTITIPVSSLKKGDTFGPRTEIHNQIPPLPPHQTVFASGGDMACIGALTVSGDSIYPTWDERTHFGRPTLTANSAFPASIRLFDQFGLPHLNATRRISPPGIEGWEHAFPSKPRVDPHTIYCQIAPPPNAVENNGGHFRLMDEEIHPGEAGGWPWFGNPEAQLKNRRITHRHGDGFQTADYTIGSFFGGETWVSNFRRYLYPTPISQFRKGYPTVNRFGELTVREPPFTEDFGTPHLGFPDGPFTRSIIVSGLTGAFGETRAELFNRELQATTAWGGVTFGLARVHPPEPAIPGMGEQTLWGDAMIAYRIRNLQPEGWDNFIAQETIGWFKDRMRVRRR